MGEAAAAFAVNKTSLGYNISQQARREDALGHSIASVQRFSEMSVLIVVIVTFLVVGVLSSRVISSVLHNLFRSANMLDSSVGSRRSAEIRHLVREAKTQAKELRVRVVVTIALVFLTVLLRATVSVFYAVAQTFQDYNNPCSGNPCSPCRNVYSNIQGWIIYTPEYVQKQRTHTPSRVALRHTPPCRFQLVGVLIASPVALLIALWGIALQSSALGADAALPPTSPRAVSLG
jgi:hypothetical protein